MGCGESKNTGGDTATVEKPNIGTLMAKDPTIANVAPTTPAKAPEVKASEAQPTKEVPVQQAAPRSTGTGSAADEQ